MDKILKHKALRRNFFLTIGSILITLILSKIILDNFLYKKILINLIDGLLVNIVTTLIIGLFLFYLTPKNTDTEQFKFLPTRELKSIFDLELRNSSIWKFKGGLGRYFRIQVIPFLSAEASRLHKSIEIIGIILNPNNPKLCTEYAKYRNTVQNFDYNTEWTCTKVKEELFATIIISLLYHQKQSLVNIELYVTDYFSPTRIDIASKSALLTKIDRNAPATQVSRDTYFYQSYEHEIVISKIQAEKVQYLKKDYPSINKLIKEDVIEILKECGKYDESLDIESYQNVLKLIKEKNNPYV